MPDKYQKCIGRLYKFRYGDTLYKFVIGVKEGTSDKIIIEQIGGKDHGMITEDTPIEFFLRYKLVVPDAG